MIRKIFLSWITATSLIFLSSQAFALINFSVGVPLSYTFKDSDVAESDGVSGTFIQVGIPTAHGAFAHQVTAQSEGTKIQNEKEEESHYLIIALSSNPIPMPPMMLPTNAKPPMV